MSIASSVTRGFGSYGSIALVVTRGYSISELVSVPDASIVTRGYGANGTIARLVTRGYGISGAVSAPDASIVTRGYGSHGTIARLVTRGYGIEESAQVVDNSLGGGDDAWLHYQVASKPRKKDLEGLADEIKALYEGLPAEEKREVQPIVSEFATNRKAARRAIVPTAQINWGELSGQIDIVEALIAAHQKALDSEETEFLLLSV